MSKTTVNTFIPKVSADVPWEVSHHITLLYQKLNSLAQNVVTSHAAATGSTTTIERITAGGGSSGGGGSTAVIGAVNDQSGNTAYTTQPTDNGAVIILNDASPVAVTLGTASATPWFCWITNLGAGTATLTPSSGTINGGASFALLQNYTTAVFFDGANFYAGSSPIVPVNTAGAAHEWLASYNATTGIFTLSQPAFSDISGIASVAQGGTGTATPALVAGTNVSITGTWPDQTINSTTSGLSVTITTAALTTGGTQGSQTFTNGLLTAQVQAT